SLEYQTATSEVLDVISRSPTDPQPVFDIIGERALKLCKAQFSVITMLDGMHLHLASICGATEEGLAMIRSIYPIPVESETLSARAIRTKKVMHEPDVLANPHYYAKGGGWRGGLAVPMLRSGNVIGAIFVGRSTPGLFASRQVALLQT